MYWLDKTESGLAFSFLWNKSEKKKMALSPDHLRNTANKVMTTRVVIIVMMTMMMMMTSDLLCALLSLQPPGCAV